MWEDLRKKRRKRLLVILGSWELRALGMKKKIFKKAKPLSKEDQLLVNLYKQIGIPLDSLPYTTGFERLFKDVQKKFPERTKKDVIQRLFRLRKAARLPRMGAALSDCTKPNVEDAGLLVVILKEFLGTLGKRDRLPYTNDFDKLVDLFNKKRAGESLDPHAVWRLVCHVAK